MIDSQLSLYSDGEASISTGGRKGQVRLAELSVYNWGSFGDRIHTASIDPEGTLITGGNGSGKSTLIDGLMALLLSPGRASFNIAAAQGDRRDRTLMSYMRGSYGTSHDGAGTRVLNKRSKEVVTALRALYHYDGGSSVTLLAIFYINQASNSYSDINKLYFIADGDISLKTLLDAFSNRSIREFKKWVDGQVDLTCFDDKFSEYQSIYRQKLNMSNENAPALLSRALGLKKIDDLTKLIRELVLEPGNIREVARDIVSEFADLVATHERLVDTREQLNHLQRLIPIYERLQTCESLIAQLACEQEGLSVFYAKKQVVFLDRQIEGLDGDIEFLKDAIEQLIQEEQAASSYVEQCYGEYFQLGGNQIETTREKLKSLQEQLQKITRESQRYQHLCRELQLDGNLELASFRDNQQVSGELVRQAEFESPRLDDAYLAEKQKATTLASNVKELRTQITEIQQRPNSNIELKYQQLRDLMVSELSIDAEQLIYIGELIDVQEQYAVWQGAIERALASRKLTLLVPDAHYKRVTAWLNQRHLGLSLRAQVVQLSQGSVEFKRGGFLEKLSWREHPYQRWLQQHLNRFDLECVDSVEALNSTAYSMTVNGLIHLKQGSFEKKDLHKIDDRRYWQLGFDSKAKLNLLLTQQKELEQALVEAQKLVTQSQQARDSYAKLTSAREKLLGFEWDSIDLPTSEAERSVLIERLQALEDSQGDVQKAQARWESAKRKVTEIQQKKETKHKQLGGLESRLATASNERQQVLTLSEEELSEEVELRLEERVGGSAFDKTLFDAAGKKLSEQYKKATDDQGKDKTSIVSILAGFRAKEKWQPLTVDWVSDFEAIHDALDYLNYLEKEGLPKLVEQYQERLNKNITQSIALFNLSVEAEFSDIRDRIDRINKVLSKTEFRPNSYLKLNSRRDKYPFIHDFSQKMNLALSSINDVDQDKRFDLVNDVVSILRTALDSTRVDDERLLDPRKQMSFYAEEIHQETGDILDVLDSSSGKSGGEKEAFAGTIVAASLAYVLTPKDEEYPVYATIFLDEAFSNAAEGVAARVIKVFKALKLHINLITPYKNLNVARDAARSLILAERNEKTHESRLQEVTWEVIDSYQAERYHQLKEYVEEHGVLVNDN